MRDIPFRKDLEENRNGSAKPRTAVIMLLLSAWTEALNTENLPEACGSRIVFFVH
jgi:hypothetical protein